MTQCQDGWIPCALCSGHSGGFFISQYLFDPFFRRINKIEKNQTNGFFSHRIASLTQSTYSKEKKNEMKFSTISIGNFRCQQSFSISNGYYPLKLFKSSHKWSIGAWYKWGSQMIKVSWYWYLYSCWCRCRCRCWCRYARRHKSLTHSVDRSKQSSVHKTPAYVWMLIHRRLSRCKNFINLCQFVCL